jgi:transposase InsO family protein
VPWTTATPMSQRHDFVRLAHQGRHPITEVCVAFGISEKTGHKWLARFAAAGVAGLVDRSHAPHRMPHQLAASLTEAILALRAAHPTWGPRKLRARLGDTRPDLPWPATSTIGALLHRRGLVRPHRRPGGGPARWGPLDHPLTAAAAPNDVWTTDFKGEFRVRAGPYCFPLTVVDAQSRFLLGCTALGSPASAPAQVVFTRLFRTYGLPRVIRSDNGVPFASPLALSRLSALAVWWIRLGIRPERIARGAPQQNGAHERLHKTLKAEATHPPQRTLARQQACFDHFRAEYNTERPHEALGLCPPARCYTPSPRPWPRRLPRLDYPPQVEIRRVSSAGCVKWKGDAVWLTSVLAGQDVAFEPTAPDGWTVSFGSLVLGLVDAVTRTFTPESYWKLDPPDLRSRP